MSNDTKIDLNLPDLILTSNELNQIANECINLIKERTSKGLDEDGKPFKPYSKRPLNVYNKTYKGGYEEFKKSKGSSNVDLKLTGKLLNSIKPKSIGTNSVSISVEGVSYAEKVFEDRPIMNLTKQEIEMVKQMILERIMKK